MFTDGLKAVPFKERYLIRVSLTRKIEIESSHGWCRIVPSLKGLGFFVNAYPGLTSWAIVLPPFGLVFGQAKRSLPKYHFLSSAVPWDS
jgi:hypothetical protein